MIIMVVRTLYYLCSIEWAYNQVRLVASSALSSLAYILAVKWVRLFHLPKHDGVHQAFAVENPVFIAFEH